MNNLGKIVVTDINELFTVSSPKGRLEKICKRKSYALSFCIIVIKIFFILKTS